ncbi:hypothetical protein BCR35DRAFT_135345 [Leucosporidium creatinivorum]|uniref:F-box domain-containing protein n=1 Tax=Leucosporidium creatinivorum TaxID=106004 RepID=A0A1Y2G0S1_9BASI|nr:hypothetical protein BCR35DRAFT_135345 [Leucosporidium creatinivorum]
MTSPPTLPIELVSDIVDRFSRDRRNLSAFCLVAKSWLPVARSHLYRDVSLSRWSGNREVLYNTLTTAPHLTIWVRDLDFNADSLADDDTHRMTAKLINGCVQLRKFSLSTDAEERKQAWPKRDLQRAIALCGPRLEELRVSGRIWEVDPKLEQMFTSLTGLKRLFLTATMDSDNLEAVPPVGFQLESLNLTATELEPTTISTTSSPNLDRPLHLSSSPHSTVAPTSLSSPPSAPSSSPSTTIGSDAISWISRACSRAVSSWSIFRSSPMILGGAATSSPRPTSSNTFPPRSNRSRPNFSPSTLPPSSTSSLDARRSFATSSESSCARSEASIETQTLFFDRRRRFRR